MLIVAASPFAFATGCSDECAPGYEREDYLCRAAASADAGDPGAAGAAGEAGAAGAGACEVSTLGADCRSTADCVCDTDFCAGYPGQVGLCTRTGCLSDPSVCPAGWGCMDLASFGPGLPSVCTPP